MNASLGYTSNILLLAAWVAMSPARLTAAQPPEGTGRDVRVRQDQTGQEHSELTSPPDALNAAAAAGAGGEPDTGQVLSFLLKRLRQQDESGESSYQLAAAVGRMGPAAAPAAPILTRWLRDPSTIVQYHAFVALGQVNPRSPISFEASEPIQRLESGSPEVQYATLLAMQQQPALRGAEIPIVNAIVKETPQRGLKCFALETLGFIGAAHAGTLRTILGCVAETDEFVSETGVRALRRMDTNQAELVPVLAEALSSASWKARSQAAEALRQFGPRAKPAVPALTAALCKADGTYKHEWVGAYLEALRAVGPGAVEAADPIVRLLPERSALYRNRSKSEVEKLRAFMLVTLSEVGIPDSALPFILDALANSNTLRIYAAGAVAAGALGARAADATPFLHRALRPKSGEFTRGVGHFVGAMGIDSPFTFESYVGSRPKSGIYTSVRIEAIRALGKIGPAAKSATSLLTELALREESAQRFSRMPLLSEEARSALALIGGTQVGAADSLHSKSERIPSTVKAAQ